MIKPLLILAVVYCNIYPALADTLLPPPFDTKTNSIIAEGASTNASMDLAFSDDILALSLYQTFFEPITLADEPHIRRYKEAAGVPLNGCKPEQDPFKCAEPVIYDLSADYHWVKPGRKISFQVHMANYTEATLAAYDYATQKLVTIQRWKSGISQRTRELKTNPYLQNNDTIYHLEVKNPHGQDIKTFTIYNFRNSQDSAAAASASRNTPQILRFSAKPNPISINSPTRVKPAFIGADEYFLLRNNRVITHKKNLNPDLLQEPDYKEWVRDKGPHLFKLIAIRNLSSDPEKNKRIEKTIQLGTTPAAEIIEFSSNKNRVLAGEKVSFKIKVSGAEYIYLDMQEEGGLLQNFPLTPPPSMPLQRSKTYQFSTFMNVFDNTDFRLRISNPDSGTPATKTIKVLAEENLVTHQIQIRSFSVKPKFAAGEKVMARFVATNAVYYTLYSNEGGSKVVLDAGPLVPDNLGFVTKSIPITLTWPATELTLAIRHTSGGSVIKTIPVEMYWKVKYSIPVKTVRVSPRPENYIQKLAVACRMGDRRLQRNFFRIISKRDNYIKTLKGDEIKVFTLGTARYNFGSGIRTETFTDVLTFEQELQFEPAFRPSLVPFTCDFRYARVCKKENGNVKCNIKDDHSIYAKSYTEAYDKADMYQHNVNFTNHGDFSKPFIVNLRKTMEWVEKP